MGLMFPKRRTKAPAADRGKDVGHLRLIRACPCLACLAEPAEAAHVRYSDAARGKVNPGIGRKPEDRWTVPLCPRCHRTGTAAQHSTNERAWWEAHRIDPLAAAIALHRISTTCRSRKLAEHMTIELMRAEVRRRHRRITNQ